MNLLFATQSFSLGLFDEVCRAMHEFTPIEKVGFYITDSLNFEDHARKNPDFAGSHTVLKEWEIIGESKNVGLDLSYLAGVEEKIGNPVLWNVLLADRRVFFGRKCAYRQHYTPRFTHEQMLKILQLGIQKMERLFDEIRPDCVISFQCVTLGDYLSALLAKARGIPLLNLRPTRIKNCIFAGEEILEPSFVVETLYKAFLQEGTPSDLRRKAEQYLDDFRHNHALYEGSILPSRQPPKIPSRTENRSVLRKLGRLFIRETQYRLGYYKDDNSISGFLEPVLTTRVLRPFRSRWINRKLGTDYVQKEHLSKLQYAFFPLHVEPEVMISVHSKAYLNQIEAVRLVSHNLPVGFKLIVKEHPASVGKRPLGYYQKLIEIPNVLLADPALSARELIVQCQLVTLIAGSITFETMILQKPVVVLGRTPFNFLPETMIHVADRPGELGWGIWRLLKNHRADDDALMAYIAAVIQSSVPVDLVTILLGRSELYRSPERENLGSVNGQDRNGQIRSLARYLLSTFNQRRSVEKTTIRSA